MPNTLVLHGSYARYTNSPLAQKNMLVQAQTLAQTALARQTQTTLSQNVVSDDFSGYLPEPGDPISDDYSGYLETK